HDELSGPGGGSDRGRVEHEHAVVLRQPAVLNHRGVDVEEHRGQYTRWEFSCCARAVSRGPRRMTGGPGDQEKNVFLLLISWSSCSGSWERLPHGMGSDHALPAAHVLPCDELFNRGPVRPRRGA